MLVSRAASSLSSYPCLRLTFFRLLIIAGRITVGATHYGETSGL
jgi:hypothetical protein